MENNSECVPFRHNQHNDQMSSIKQLVDDVAVNALSILKTYDMCDDAVSVATRKTIRRTRMHNACPSIRCSNSWELLPMGLGLDPHRFRNLCLIGLRIVAQGRGN